jgi:O-antigen ligase
MIRIRAESLIMFGILFMATMIALFSGLASATYPILILIVIMMPAMILVAIWKLHWAVLLLLVFSTGLIPPQLTPRLPLLGGTVRAEDLLLAFTVCIAFLKFLAYKNRNKSKIPNFESRLYYPVYFFAALVVFSLLIAFGIFDNKPKYVAYELRVCLYWLYGFVLYFSITSEDLLKRTIHFIVILSIIMAIAVITQSITGWRILSHSMLGTLDNAGVLLKDVNRSTFGGFQNFVVFALVILLVHLSRGTMKFYAAAPLLMIIIVGIVVTFGRMVWATTFVSVFIASAWLGRRHFIRIAAMGMIITICIVSVVSVVRPVLIEAVVARLTSVDKDLRGGESWGWRQGENEYAVKKISQYPVFGIGLGGEYQPVRNRQMDTEQTRMIHNSYLYLLLKFGIIGLIFPIWLCFSIWRECWRLSRSKNSTAENRALAVAVGAALWMPVLTGYTQPEWMEAKGVLFISTMLALLVAQERFEKQKRMDEISSQNL